MTRPAAEPVQIREPSEADCARLSELLCRDDVLRADLGTRLDQRPTAALFRAHLREWCARTHSTTYAIVVGETAVGTISLSHVSDDGRSARVGYWVGSAHRRRGHCRAAFAAVVDIAREKGIAEVRARIEEANVASRRVWEGAGASWSAGDGGKLEYVLGLG